MKKVLGILLAIVLLFGLAIPAFAAGDAQVKNIRATTWDIAGSDFALRYVVVLEFEATTWGNITINNVSNVYNMSWYYEGDPIPMQDREVQFYNNGTFGLVGAPSGNYQVTIVTKGFGIPYFRVNGNLALDWKGWICYVVLFGWLYA